MSGNQSLSNTFEDGFRRSLLQPVVDQSPALIAVVSRKGAYLFANAQFARVLGLPADALVGRNEDDVLRTVDGAEILRVDKPAAEAGPANFVEEGPIRGRRRRFIMSRYPLRNSDGEAIATCLSATELSATELAGGEPCDDVRAALAIVEERNNELQRALEQMEHLAYTDRLTGAWNRRHLEDAALIEMSRAERHGFPASMLIIDIDHFKALNDSHGHAVGDRVLVDLVCCIRNGIRRADTVTRWGGEEFVVLAPDTPLHEAEQLARKIRDHVAATVFVETLAVTVSIGVAEYECGAGLESWFAHADRALYRAKSGGRNRVVCDPLTAFRATLKRPRRSPLQLNWRDAYCSGHALLDTQHERLFEHANLLLDAIVSRASREDTLRIVHELLADVREHFADEERIHAEAGFPDRRAHAAEHARLLDKATGMFELIVRDDVPAIDLFQFLAYDVIAQHMLGSDRSAFPYLARHEESRDGRVSN
ncbi:diguanylate cyclase [Aromatoleum sp.]|uniref:diguanylate cyclase n=1 Tax=Aromatoleum sp. TaxID=2307007 RepID=UPI002FC638D4